MRQLRVCGSFMRTAKTRIKLGSAQSDLNLCLGLWHLLKFGFVAIIKATSCNNGCDKFALSILSITPPIPAVLEKGMAVYDHNFISNGHAKNPLKRISFMRIEINLKGYKLRNEFLPKFNYPNISVF